MHFGSETLVFLAISLVAHCLASSDDRFIKKYAMMKIYESCFGPEVVKQIRQEMREACAKCAAASSDSAPNHAPAMFIGRLPPGFSMDPGSQTITKPDLEQENDLPTDQHNVGKPPQQMPFRPQAQFPPQQMGGVPPFPMSPNGQFRPFGNAAPFYQFPYTNPNMFYPGMGFNPYQQYQPYQNFYQQPYYGTHRMSRQLDIRDRLDMIAQSGSNARARNITCVMQELGYLDHKLEPNYEKITARIANLPVSAELRGDIQDGLQFCQKFAQCVPDVKKDVAPLSKELIKPMFFFRCYKHKKLEACIMKDIRERFTSEDDLDTDTDFRSLGRSGKSLRDSFPITDPQIDALDEMSVYLYDFLSGSNSFDFDMYM